MTPEIRPAHTTPHEPTSSRWTIRVVGVLFLAAMLTYGPGSGLTAAVLDASDILANVAANQTRFTLGAVLMLLNSVIVASIGVLLYPILRRHSERIAAAYYASRLTEAVLLTVGVLSLLSLIGISEGYTSAGTAGPHFETLASLAIQVNDLAYQIGMAALGVGSLFFCYLLHRTRLVPRLLALWGLAGYAVFLTGALAELFGVEVGLLLSIPGGLFEVTFGLWLIVKGMQLPPTLPSPRQPARPHVHADLRSTR
jgi:hypothetical protein